MMTPTPKWTAGEANIVFEAECPHCHANTTAGASMHGLPVTIECWQCKFLFDAATALNVAGD